MSEEVFAGLLSDDFGYDLKPRPLLRALDEHGYVKGSETLKQFTAYGYTYVTGHLITLRMLEDRYFMTVPEGLF